MNVAFVRGAYLNQFETQNYRFEDSSVHITAFSSLHPIHTEVPFPRIGLPSLTDIRFPRFIANRTIGDNQLLLGLERSVRGYDIAHTADPHYFYSYQLARMRERNAIGKLLVSYWDTIPFNNESTHAKKRIKRFTMNKADAFLCYGRLAAQCLRHEGIPAGRIHTIPLGVDLNRFTPLSTASARKNINILYVGRLVPEKGILDLLNTFILMKNSSIYLTIAGDGPLYKTIADFIRSHSLTRSVSMRISPYSEIHREYQNADIAVVPSKPTKTWEEQYGMILIEAMASGLPVVAYRSGAIPDILGDAGIMVPVSNIKKLAHVLSGLIGNKPLRHKLGTMSRRRAERLYDARKTARAIARLYRSL